MKGSVTNIILAGLGGQGVLKASDILADAAFRAGHQVKKAEVHGMSQRGGSVTSDVRFGKAVLSPMVPSGQTDYLVILDESQREAVRHLSGDRSILLSETLIQKDELPNSKALNIAMLGVLSTYLTIPEQAWQEAIQAAFPERLHEANSAAFAQGRLAGNTGKGI